MVRLFCCRLQTTADRCDLGNVTIDILPDEVLLEIFDIYVYEYIYEDDWETLLHVCRRWRYIVFSAPRRLDLRIVCTAGTPAREMLDIWPELPILIRWTARLRDAGLDDIIAALEHNDRVCEIEVDHPTDYAWGRIMEAMQRPFPLLTGLHLWSLADDDDNLLALPDSLLNGSATRLRSLSIEGVPFPALPNLLLSASNLLCLSLEDIPPSGYISSATMIDHLSSLTKLEELRIVFRSSHLGQETRRPPPAARFVLPVLSQFTFQGGSEYLADIFGSIDTPLLQYSNITFLDLITFRMSQTSSFIGYTSTKPIEGLHRAHLLFNHDWLKITLSSPKLSLVFSVKYTGIESLWQFRSLNRVYYRLSPVLANNERYDFRQFGDERPSPLWAARMANASWLELLRPLAAIKHLYLSEGVALCLAPTLKRLARGSGVTGVGYWNGRNEG
jgi:hypothetical protein